VRRAYPLALAFRGALFAVAVALTLQLGVFAGPAQAHIPTLSTAASSVTVDEGQVARNSGFYCTEESFFHQHSSVSVWVSRGTVVQNDPVCGSWSWSYETDDGPTESGGGVTVMATTDRNESRSITFSLGVTNVAPTAALGAPESADEGRTFAVSLDDPSDPSSADTQAGFEYAFDCGDGSGYGARGPADTALCKARIGAVQQTVKAKIFDRDDGAREYTREVTVIDDTSAPEVESATPSGGTAVLRSTDLTATFSEEMIPTTLNTSTFKLYRVNPDRTTRRVANVTVTPVPDGLGATLNPFGDSATRLLAKNTRYKAVITTGAQDLAENSLDQDQDKRGGQQKVWYFTTGTR
jgi:hypothetical protein